MSIRKAVSGEAPLSLQVAANNEWLFLVNDSRGLYPELLQDRERWKGRFGRIAPALLGAVLSAA